MVDGPLRTGTRVSAYEIEKLLGTGGMGSVYRARHLLDERVVALKVLREDQLEQERAVDRMMREASILATVPHGGIPRFYECGLLGDGRPWIAMELVQGTPLAVRLHEGPLPHCEVLDLVGAVSGVLAAAHARGVTHRDLKPDNILLVPGDPVYPVRVIDWGIAHHVAGARYTSMNEAIGTPTYMAPEQARGGPTNGHCDVYGLGIVAYQALTGRPPFVGSTSVEILVQHLNKPIPSLAPRCPDAPLGFVELVEHMLVKCYESRPSASEVANAVTKLRDDRRPAYACDDTGPVVIGDLEEVPVEKTSPTVHLRPQQIE
ncbi:MAG: serine/threonine protein kinase [Deltaproteobacteria bacterium]|nr:serine/threonine protein kinase [Deltaproteobacteria bacterium]